METHKKIKKSQIVGKRMIAFVIESALDDADAPEWAQDGNADVAASVSLTCAGPFGEGFFPNDMLTAVLAGLHALQESTEGSEVPSAANCHRVATGMIEVFKLSVAGFQAGTARRS